MLRKLHLANAQGRDATVVFLSLQPEDPPTLGLPGTPVTFRRWLAATESGLHDALAAERERRKHLNAQLMGLRAQMELYAD